MNYIIRYKTRNEFLKDYWLAVDGSGPYADDDWVGAERFATRKDAEDMLNYRPRVDESGSWEDGVVEECH